MVTGGGRRISNGSVSGCWLANNTNHFLSLTPILMIIGIIMTSGTTMMIGGGTIDGKYEV